jgi:very-short-patch-repair endonuclease
MNEAIKRTKERVLHDVSEFLDLMEEHSEGDSPIEQALFFALTVYVEYTSGCTLGIWLSDNSREELLEIDRIGATKQVLVVQRQAQLDGWRVDFLISVFSSGYPRDPLPGWRQLIVECDGHNFHERTADQAARDRSRDRQFQDKGVTVFRFTGREIWADAWGCAQQIIKWAEKGR